MIRKIVILSVFLFMAVSCAKKSNIKYTNLPSMIVRTPWSLAKATGAYAPLREDRNGPKIVFYDNGKLTYKYMGQADSVYLDGDWRLNEENLAFSLKVGADFDEQGQLYTLNLNTLTLVQERDTLRLTAVNKK